MNTPVDDWLTRIDAAITGRHAIRNFTTAVQLANKALTEHPQEPKIWVQLVLAYNLTNQHQAALRTHSKASAQCTSWSVTYNGDCERDHALYCIRRKLAPQAFAHLATATKDHQQDNNRIALLKVVEARIWYMLGYYTYALQLFTEAFQYWKTSTIAQSQWQFNSSRWLLKTLVASGKRKSTEAQTAWRQLQRQMSCYGSPDIKVRLHFIMQFGRIANKLDDILESETARRILTNPFVLQFAKRFLSS